MPLTVAGHYRSGRVELTAAVDLPDGPVVVTFLGAPIPTGTGPRRSLRGWLRDPTGPPATNKPAETLAAVRREWGTEDLC
ncbi:MAG: hypothetical protein IT204_08190 [Fimbriimonadaceae bacterium]|nr:hypothetical protein [Fimbriimonadaceae bacterium]